MEKTPPDLELILKYFTGLRPLQMQQLVALDRLYKDWNSKVNVISRNDISNLYEKHVLHSLSIAAVTAFRPGSQVIDIGTGGGFPGIPLAIFFADVHFHLVDSVAKKLKVVDEIAVAIGLTNITTQHTRAEAIKDRRFDFAVSRAVAPLKELCRWSRPLLSKNTASLSGTSPSSTLHTKQLFLAPGLICLKGGDLTKEIAESGTSPAVFEIREIFPEPFFDQKFVVYVDFELH